jgi:hypothetical protein
MPVLLTEQAGRVLELLAMYIQSPGASHVLEHLVFRLIFVECRCHSADPESGVSMST